MSAEECVDAALAGLDQGETVTLPSVEQANLWAEFEAARITSAAAILLVRPTRLELFRRELQLQLGYLRQQRGR
jgi:hypothetical protein